MHSTSKTFRQYFSLLIAVIAYFIFHEGAHLLLSLFYKVFEHIKFMGLGMQIVIDKAALSENQFILFNLGGVLATLALGYLLVIFIGQIVKITSKLGKSVFYYITLTMLFSDCIYLSILSGFFGGGDMNGIALLFPSVTFAKILFGVIGIINLFIFIKFVYPKYVHAFNK
ncbi:hypothetical protein [Bacillus sp. 1P06AnD]|uniref:hypothetical protein n=1 Tax=Bacillus sp. 1P06AnD TaxID=3132208 RepID=UPI0039A1E598